VQVGRDRRRYNKLVEDLLLTFSTLKYDSSSTTYIDTSGFLTPDNKLIKSFEELVTFQHFLCIENKHLWKLNATQKEQNKYGIILVIEVICRVS
jgi:hypothetical protein